MFSGFIYLLYWQHLRNEEVLQNYQLLSDQYLTLSNQYSNLLSELQKFNSVLESKDGEIENLKQLILELKQQQINNSNNVESFELINENLLYKLLD